MTTQGHIVGPLELPRKRQTCIGLKQFQTTMCAMSLFANNNYAKQGLWPQALTVTTEKVSRLFLQV